MNGLEARFRRQFVPVQGGFAFTHSGREVVFSADEVEGFVAEWRRLWLNPLTWGLYLAVGVIAPLWLSRIDFGAGAVALAATAAVMLAVVLVHSVRRPHEVAWERLPALPHEPLKDRAPSWLQLIFFGILCVGSGLSVWHAGLGDASRLSFFLLWAGLFLSHAWQMLQYKRGKWVAGQSDLFGLVLIGAPSIGFITVTLLDPHRPTSQLGLAIFLVVVMLVMAGAALWNRLRPKPHAV